MSFVYSSRLEWLYQRCGKESVSHLILRSALFICSLLILVLAVWSIGVRLCYLLTSRYVAGQHSVLLMNSPNEQVAKDIGRAIMERRMAASIDIIPRTSAMYHWKGNVQDSTETLMLVKTKTSRIKTIIDYIRSVHPYANPEVLSFAVDDGSLDYMKWMDEAIPDA